ncbi:hypothetical protein [Georgenia muralis]|uniref:Uncharacterized protein n=1 Tax=Georgenia muralis TaxID=154117 RepID=A0A3N4Z4S8_9MICO|nr:hypothetical protein [Georgenia muralis]RPF26904.1 hypothetical protein EDD32_1363 [Georgenia muralis]
MRRAAGGGGGVDRAVVARAAAAGLTAAAVLAGCTDATDDALGGFGLPVVDPDDVPGEREQLTGVVHVERDGCFTWTGDGDGDGDSETDERRWVVWPRGAEQDGDRVRLEDGDEITDGDTLTGTGLRADAAALPDWELTDSYFRAFGTFCGADERGIVVLDDVRLDRP